MYQLQNFIFPKNFIFGVADADLQVIGEKNTLKEEKSELTMWTDFAKNSNFVYNNDTPLEGIDRYHRWKEDIDIIEKLGIRNYRTSISMARIMNHNKKPNKKALKWYADYFKALKKKGILIYATLYHWELPQYLSEKGGWKNRETIEYFLEHVRIVYKYLNEYINEYFIINEPYQSTFASYHYIEHAPGETSLKGALAAVHNTLLAQGFAFQVLKGFNTKLKVSTVYNPTVTYAASSDEKDILAAKHAYGYQSAMFLDPLYRGVYPEYMMDVFGDEMPKIKPDDMKNIKVGGGLESFGVNYYRGKVIKYDPTKELKFVEVKYPQGIKNGLGWTVHLPPTYPESLYDLLRETYHRYESYGMKNIYIAENGTCWPDEPDTEGVIDDDFRIFYIKEHLRQIQKAILAGIPMRGYFVWTLMDNYEWECGYKLGSNFGIVHVDRKTMKRIPKNSYYWYKEVIKTRKI